MAAPPDDPMQDAVDALAEQLGLPVLIEDPQFRPVWWSAQGVVDATRIRTIMERSVSPAARALPKRLHLDTAVGPVRTPADEAAEMLPRWCVPVRAKGHLLGYLWIIDPDGLVGDAQLPRLIACAERAGSVLGLAHEEATANRTRREELLEELQQRADPKAADELRLLERLSPQVVAGVDLTGSSRGRWLLGGGLGVHVDPPPGHRCTSGAALSLDRLAVSVHRAKQVQRAIAAGASVDGWESLGAWRLVVEAPAAVEPAHLTPTVSVLQLPQNAELLRSTRVLLELGGDVAAAAAALQVHRTTLYYRVERVEALCGIDLKDPHARDALLGALRLAAFRAVN